MKKLIVLFVSVLFFSAACEKTEADPETIFVDGEEYLSGKWVLNECTTRVKLDDEPDPIKEEFTPCGTVIYPSVIMDGSLYNRHDIAIYQELEFNNSEDYLLATDCSSISEECLFDSIRFSVEESWGVIYLDSINFGSFISTKFLFEIDNPDIFTLELKVNYDRKDDINDRGHVTLTHHCLYRKQAGK